MTVLIVALVAIAGLATGCGGSSPRVPTTSTAPVAAAVSREEAALLASRLDFAGAAAAYRQLVQEHPDDLALRYAYGSVLSHLDRYADTVQQFRWVVEHGKPSQAEVRSAKEWLRQAAGAQDSVASAPEAQAPPAAAPAEPLKPMYPPPLLRGQTSWPGVDPAVRRVKLLIRVTGDDEATKGVNLPVRIDLGRPYRVASIPPGAYRVVGSVGTVVLWEQRITLETGKEMVLDLGPASSSVSPGEFPPPDLG